MTSDATRANRAAAAPEATAEEPTALETRGANGSSVRRRTGGRSARVQAAVLDAAVELLAERGIDSVSVAAVAERAGVHETSIYRRWGTRDNLLLLSAVHRLQTEVPIPDTGSLCGDVRELLRGMAVFVQSPFGEVLQRVASQTQSHEHDASRDAFLAERRSVVDAVLQRAAARGELRQDVDASVVFDALLGPLNRRVTITREPLDDAFLEGLAGIITLGIGAQRRRQPAAASRRPSS